MWSMDFKKLAKMSLAMMSAGALLAACGNGDSADSGKDTSAGADDQATVTELSEPVEITFWHAMNGPHQEALTELVNKFNESQDMVTVNEQGQGSYDDLNQSIKAAATSGDLPTMTQLTPTDVPELASNDILVPLTDEYLTERGLEQETLDDIYEGFLDSSLYQGERFALPFSKSVRVMFYNQDLLDEHDAEVPKSWDDLVALGQKMAEANSDAVALGLENGIEMEWETLARQNGSKFADGEVAELNTPEAVEPLEMIQTMLDEGYARTAGEDGYMSGPFGNGASAVYIGSSAGTAHVAPAAEGINWSTAPIPTYNDTELALFAGNDLGLFQSASAEEQLAFVEFMKFLLEPENSAQWAEATGYLPVRQSALESDSYQKFLEENPAYKAPTEMLDYGMASQTFANYSTFRQNTIDAMESVTISGNKPQDALDTLQKQTEALYQEN